MVIYLIVTENGHSHDWGGEFFYNEEEAIDRAKELEEMCDNMETFSVVSASLIELTDKPLTGEE